MAIRDQWHKALIFSGLVDDNPQINPDYLAWPPPVPGAEPPSAQEPAAHEAPPAHELAPGAHGEKGAEGIVVRRLPPPIPAPTLPPLRAIEPIPTTAPGPPQPVWTPSQPVVEVPAPAPLPLREVSVHRVTPRSFNDAQQVADRFKDRSPVILDLRGVESDLAKRLIGFASGLTYGLDGGMERLDDRVFLLVPRGVEIPPAQRARLAAQGSLAH